MNYDYILDLIGLICDVNPNEISSQIAGDHLGRFCENIKDESKKIFRKMMDDGYCQAIPVIHCADCGNNWHGYCVKHDRRFPDDYYCADAVKRPNK